MFLRVVGGCWHSGDQDSWKITGIKAEKLKSEI